MGFSYATRTRQYIDMTGATWDDRIKVTLENDQVVTLRAARTGYRELEVDRKRTDPAVLEELYRYIMDRERNGYAFHGLSGFWRRRQHLHSLPSIEEVRQTAVLSLSVRSNDDAFDESPRVGERLHIMPTLPSRGGTGWASSALIAKVEFYTL